MIRPRSDGVILLHGPSNAARAARTAWLMSSASPSATQASVSPVAGWRLTTYDDAEYRFLAIATRQ